MIVNDTGKARRVSIVLAVVLGILQLSIVPNVAILGGRANLALVFVATVCLGGETSKAPFVGFFAGLFYDLAGSGPIGLMTLLLTLTGFALSAAGRSRVSDDPTASMVLFVPVALVVEALYAIVLLLFRRGRVHARASRRGARLHRPVPRRPCPIQDVWRLGRVWRQALERPVAEGPVAHELGNHSAHRLHHHSRRRGRHSRPHAQSWGERVQV